MLHTELPRHSGRTLAFVIASCRQSCASVQIRTRNNSKEKVSLARPRVSLLVPVLRCICRDCTTRDMCGGGRRGGGWVMIDTHRVSVDEYRETLAPRAVLYAAVYAARNPNDHGFCQYESYHSGTVKLCMSFLVVH